MSERGQHGGAREGAGRPALPERERREARVTFRLRPDDLARLDNWARAQGHETRSAALVALVRRLGS